MCLFRKGGTIQSHLLSSSSHTKQLQVFYVYKEMVEQSNTVNPGGLEPYLGLDLIYTQASLFFTIIQLGALSVPKTERVRAG